MLMVDERNEFMIYRHCRLETQGRLRHVCRQVSHLQTNTSSLRRQINFMTITTKILSVSDLSAQDVCLL